MTDIYIRRKKNNKGCFRLVVLGALILLALLIWGMATLRQRRAAQLPAETSAVAAPDENTERVIDNTTTEVETPDNSMDRLADARKAQQEEHFLAARNISLSILEESDNSKVRRQAEQLLNAVNISLVMTPRIMPEKVDYTIKRGDTLSGLAKKFKTTVQLIKKSNNIRGAMIRSGDFLRIPTGDFAISVSKSRNDLVVTFNNQYFKRYRVGTGKFGKTPTGRFVISEKIKHPPWWRPNGKMVPYGDKENVLGTHWLALRSLDDPGLRGYGIHGTWEPDTIGKQASAGCIRLLNDNVEEIFTLIPEGTPVVITE